MKNLLLVVCLVVLPFIVEAQQILANSLYHNIMPYYNPAFTASEYQLRGGLHYRNQWSGLAGAPVSYFGQYEHNFDSLNSGIGVTLMREDIGFITIQTAQINYRYELELSHVNRLSLGVSAGMGNLSVAPLWVNDYPNDPSLPGKESETKFTVNAGAMLKLNRFRLGLSALQFNQPNYDKLNYKSKAHAVLTADYKWLITRKFNLEPALFIMSDAVKASLTTLLRANYNNKFWAMAGYRSENLIIFGIGAIFFKKYSIGYNLDITRSKLTNINAQYTHGVYFNYQIQRRKNSFKIIGTPDF